MNKNMRMFGIDFMMNLLLILILMVTNHLNFLVHIYITYHLPNYFEGKWTDDDDYIFDHILLEALILCTEKHEYICVRLAACWLLDES